MLALTFERPFDLVGQEETTQFERELEELPRMCPAWILLYGDCSAPIERVMRCIKRVVPSVPIGGATSYRGLFTENGFSSGIGMLIGEQCDAIRLVMSLQSTEIQPTSIAIRNACEEVVASLGQRPNLILLHASPGSEERILDGISSEFGTEVPVYGGTAADNDVGGHWSVFSNGVTCREGFTLIGLCSPIAMDGAFLAGYLPSEHAGTVTRVSGRTVYEINGLPAAAVYNQWTHNLIDFALTNGGSLLEKTNLTPLARTVGESLGLPRRILAHPYEVDRDGKALRFFAEFNAGERVTLMTTNPDTLISRVRRVVRRAKGNRSTPIRGLLLVYCAGCLSVLMTRANEVVELLKEELPNVPFLGIATFGEQGCFFDKTASYHGNLMCSVVLF
jgi:hypothetical protein